MQIETRTKIHFAPQQRWRFSVVAGGLVALIGCAKSSDQTGTANSYVTVGSGAASCAYDPNQTGIEVGSECTIGDHCCPNSDDPPLQAECDVQVEAAYDKYGVLVGGTGTGICEVVGAPQRRAFDVLARGTNPYSGAPLTHDDVAAAVLGASGADEKTPGNKKDPTASCPTAFDIDGDNKITDHDLKAFDAHQISGSHSFGEHLFCVNSIPNNRAFKNETGTASTVTLNGSAIDTTNPFFQREFGNGRSCLTCHKPFDSWTINPDTVVHTFNLTDGKSPIFRTNDGSNRPNHCSGDVTKNCSSASDCSSGGLGTCGPVNLSSVSARRTAYSMLLNFADIRVGLPLPPGDFTLSSVNDPYGFASAAELSLFRRPLPTSNVKYLSAVMWDGRETAPAHQLTGYDSTGSNMTTCGDDNSFLCGKDWSHLNNDIFDLKKQSNDATMGHAALPGGLTTAEQYAVAKFESSIFFAQLTDKKAGDLHDPAHGAFCGPQGLATLDYWQPTNGNLDRTQFYAGINDPLGFNPLPTIFTAAIFHNYENPAWVTAGANQSTRDKRASIERGEKLFNNDSNSLEIQITDVGGLNGSLDHPLGTAVIAGACGTLFNQQCPGTESCAANLGFPLDIGLSSTTNGLLPNATLAQFPKYTLTSGATTIVVTDPGRALLTGKFKDVGKFKGPILRGAGARAAFMHNGMLATLDDVVAFYLGGCLDATNTPKHRNSNGSCPSGSTFRGRFAVKRNGSAYTPTVQDEADIVAFLSSL
ncbi:MAG: hypothetical protein NT062_36435 [Proteobacteria bacterium]|nr:hypothetical protein [Pseudomonadota bacterium]